MFKLEIFMNLKKILLRIYLVPELSGHYFLYHFTSMGQQKMMDY
jgi:hypothetical protein